MIGQKFMKLVRISLQNFNFLKINNNAVYRRPNHFLSKLNKLMMILILLI